MTVTCRKCHKEIPKGEPAFGGTSTGWEHVGSCPVPNPDVDLAYLALCQAAEQFDDNVYAVEALSLAARVLSGHKQGCDACPRELDPEPFGSAGMSWAVQVDGNGDPDVSICPVCKEESREWVSYDGPPPVVRPPLESMF